MEYIITFILTLLFVFVTIKLTLMSQDKKYNNFKYKQTDKLMILKNFSNISPVEKKKPSQLDKMNEENVINVVVVDDKAYWIADNVFYTADLVDEDPDLSTAQTVDTGNMSKEELDKMMFVLDNLNKGKQNDDSSSGN